jgi:hypothetical protein
MIGWLCCFGSVARQQAMAGVHTGVQPFTHGQEAKEREEEARVPLSPSRAHPPIT